MASNITLILKPSRRQFLGHATLLLTALGCKPSWAAWPDKPLRWVVPYAAGGGADAVARVLAQRVSTSLGQQIVIDNRPGGGGVIGADAVAKATPDGYTALYDASAFAVNPALRKLPYDASKDFVPVALVVTAPNIFVVPSAAPFKTLAEFLDLAKRPGSKLSYASAGNGSASHLSGEVLNDLAKIDLLHVPYKGGAPALADLIGGQVSAYFGNAASTLGHVKSGKVRPLAVGSSKRLSALPDVPTLIESGLAGFTSQEWNGIFLPKGTPEAVVQRLASEVKLALESTEIKDKLQSLSLEIANLGPKEFSEFLRAETLRASEVVKSRGIKLD